jgi:hypothetical protein
MKNIKIYNNQNTDTIYNTNDYVLYEDYISIKKELEVYKKAELLNEQIFETLIKLNELIKKKQKIIMNK